MKVAVVQKDLKNLRSGVSRLVRSQLQALDNAGYSSAFISEKVSRAIYLDTNSRVCKTFRWPFKGALRRRFFKWQAEFLLRRISPDISVGHGDVVRADICFIHNCVHLEHELVYGRPLPLGNDVGELHSEVLSKQYFKVLVCNSKLMKQDLVNRFNIKEKCIEVLYPSCDPQNVTNPDLNLREELGIKDNELVIGLVTSGNFKKRNVQLFLEASSQLRSDKKIHFLVAGNGKSSEYEGAVDKHQHSVIFLPSTDCVANYYAMLDVFVLPAYIEEFGMSVLDAMTCGKPVVLHCMVGASEILEGESVSFVLQSLDRHIWVDALQRLCDDSDLRERLGVLNALTAKKYTAEHQNKRFLELIESLRV